MDQVFLGSAIEFSHTLVEYLFYTIILTTYKIFSHFPGLFRNSHDLKQTSNLIDIFLEPYDRYRMCNFIVSQLIFHEAEMSRRVGRHWWC